jgi:hypothetical protein
MMSLILNLLMAIYWALPVEKRPSFKRASVPAKATTRRTGTTGIAEEE